MALNRWLVLFLVGAGLGWGLWRSAATFGEPWQHGWMAHNGARYSLAGRNFERQGFLATRFVSDLSAGPPGRMLYVHHPPLTAIVVGLARQHLAFLWPGSEHGPEDRARVVFWLLSGLNVVLVLLAGRDVLGIGGGAVAASIAGFVPITAYYGTHVEVQGSLVLCFILVAFLAFRRDQERPSRAALAASLAAFVLGMLADWPAYYLVVILPALAWLRAHRLTLRAMSYPIAALAALALQQAQVAWVGARAGVRLDAAFAKRSAEFFTAFIDRPGEAGWALARLAANIESMYSWPVLLLAGVGAALCVRARRWPGLALLAVGLLHIAIFPAGAIVHDYWSFALLPGVSVLAAAAVSAIGCGARPRQMLAALVLIASLGWCAPRAARLFALHQDGPREYLLGKLVNANTAFADVILTNGPYNPFDGQELTYPEFSYYADRRVLGGIGTPAELEQVTRTERAQFFLLGSKVVWPELSREPETIAQFLRVHASVVYSAPDVTLFRLP